jgi:2-amino-4-hydroxy-6-hydroxymethyldihydropteridine diphosphokinase
MRCAGWSASSDASRRANAGDRGLIDLDLLVLGGETRATPTLTLPHAGIAQRDFVLYPLADIAPDLEVPGLGRVRQLQACVANRGVERL